MIQSRRRPEMLEVERAEYRRAIKGLEELSFVTSLDTTLPWSKPEVMLNGYSGVIIGGSGEFDFDGGRAYDDEARTTSQQIKERVKDVVLFALEKDFPLLGICYGHQIVSEVVGVPVVNDHTQKKVGTFEVFLTDEGKNDQIFSQLPPNLMAQYGHKDSASRVPANSILLADSPQCKVAVLRYGAHVYTMQFHPELTDKDISWKLSNSPGYLPKGVEVGSVVKASPDADRIIPLFIECTESWRKQTAH